MPVRRVGVAVTIVAALLPGCGSVQTGLDLRFLSAPEAVRTRTPLHPCGVELVGSGGPYNLQARRCFWDAYSAGYPAEFITTRPTAGGTALTVIFRTLGPGRVELFADESAIRGAPFWMHTTCTAFTSTRDPAVAIDWIPGTPEAPCDQQRLGG